MVGALQGSLERGGGGSVIYFLRFDWSIVYVQLTQVLVLVVNIKFSAKAETVGTRLP